MAEQGLPEYLMFRGQLAHIRDRIERTPPREERTAHDIADLKRVILESLGGLAKRLDALPKPHKTNLQPVTDGLNRVVREIGTIPRKPPQTKVDFLPVMRAIEGLHIPQPMDYSAQFDSMNKRLDKLEQGKRITEFDVRREAFSDKIKKIVVTEA